jgi:hypothetical protein
MGASLKVEGIQFPSKNKIESQFVKFRMPLRLPRLKFNKSGTKTIGTLILIK